MASGRQPADTSNSHLKNDQIEDLLSHLDESEIEDLEKDEDEEEVISNPVAVSRRQIGFANIFQNVDWSDDTDSDPDYQPDSDLEEDEPIPSTSKGRKETLKRKKPQGGKKQKKTCGNTADGEEKNKRNNKKGKNDVAPKWEKGTFSPDPIIIHQPSYIEEDCSQWGEDDFIAQYFDDDLLKLIVEKSNQNFVFKTGKSLGLTMKELKVWIGINFTMAALQLPKIRMYWEKGYRLSLIADAMTRDRYFVIRNSLKIVFDNEISEEQKKGDRLWKIRPLIERVLEGCYKQPRHQHIAIDEMMIPFSGACSMKQYVPNKPNPVGLKAFVLANPNGIVCDFVIYQGTNTFPIEKSQGFSLCESAVICLARSLVPGHIVYIDRYFTTVKLVDALSTRGIRCTGTIMKNRIPQNTDLPEIKSYKKEERGTCVTAVREDKSIALCYWVDNNVVSLISSHEAKDPLHTVKRWSKKDKLYLQIPQPKLIQSYNKNMGGVDLADRMLAYCPSRVHPARTKNGPYDASCIFWT